MIKKIKEKRLIGRIIKDIKRKFDTIDYINIQNFSINGSALYQNKKCFFKIIDNEFFIKEINGYLISYMEIPTMKILFVKYLSNCRKYLIAYDFDNHIKKEEGLLNDLLVKNDLTKKISPAEKKEINNILNTFNKIYSNKKEYLSYCPSNIFFIERINSRLKKWYSNLFDFKKTIVINNKEFILNNIIKETINYFEKNKNKKYECVLSQGDPNTLNISTSPCLFDLATAGYNPIVGEVAITIISTLIYDNYFCPKYHPKSYYMHEQAIIQCKKFEPRINILHKKNKLLIETNIITSNIRKNYILDYLNMLEENKILIEEEIKYFIIMRLLCVFNIKKMSKKDYYYSLYLICYFYSNIKKDTYSSIRKIICEMEDLIDGKK